MTKDDARQQFLRILKTLPYGNSVFFSVRKIDDPIGLLPVRIILGINKRGVSITNAHDNATVMCLGKKINHDIMLTIIDHILFRLTVGSFLSSGTKRIFTFS